jgi:microcystin-dependent protein
MATNVTADQLVEKYQGDAVPTLPDYTKLISEGFPTDGNPSTGLVATLPGAAWFALVSAMRISVIKAAGLTPSSTPDPLQFLTALQSMSWMQDKKITYSMLVDALTATGEKAKGLTDNNCFLTPLSLQSVIDVICPPGMFGLFHATDVPEGWLLCNGATVSRTTYSRLFAKIGTKYGAGDGSTTFALPNLDGRVLQGTTNTGNVGNYLEAQLPNITGDSDNGGESNKSYSPVGAFSSSVVDENTRMSHESANDTNLEVITIDASRVSSIYNGTKLQPSALQTLACIKI